MPSAGRSHVGLALLLFLTTPSPGATLISRACNNLRGVFRRLKTHSGRLTHSLFWPLSPLHRAPGMTALQSLPEHMFPWPHQDSWKVRPFVFGLILNCLALNKCKLQSASASTVFSTLLYQNRSPDDNVYEKVYHSSSKLTIHFFIFPPNEFWDAYYLFSLFVPEKEKHIGS